MCNSDKRPWLLIAYLWTLSATTNHTALCTLRSRSLNPSTNDVSIKWVVDGEMYHTTSDDDADYSLEQPTNLKALLLPSDDDIVLVNNNRLAIRDGNQNGHKPNGELIEFDDDNRDISGLIGDWATEDTRDPFYVWLLRVAVDDSTHGHSDGDIEVLDTRAKRLREYQLADILSYRITSLHTSSRLESTQIMTSLSLVQLRVLLIHDIVDVMLTSFISDGLLGLDNIDYATSTLHGYRSRARSASRAHSRQVARKQTKGGSAMEDKVKDAPAQGAQRGNVDIRDIQMLLEQMRKFG